MVDLTFDSRKIQSKTGLGERLWEKGELFTYLDSNTRKEHLIMGVTEIGFTPTRKYLFLEGGSTLLASESYFNTPEAEFKRYIGTAALESE